MFSSFPPNVLYIKCHYPPNVLYIKCHYPPNVLKVLHWIPKVDTENVERGSKLQINTLFRGDYLFVEDDDFLKGDCLYTHN